MSDPYDHGRGYSGHIPATPTKEPIADVMDDEIAALKARVAELEEDVRWKSKRDGNATVELCYNDGLNPFARQECKVVDFGRADNCYVIEIDEESMAKARTANEPPETAETEEP